MDFLEADNIVKRYTGHTALDNVSLHVPKGCVYGLLGPNGAGKTTLIRIINHITAPDSGTVTLGGEPLTATSVSRIGYLPEERGLYKKMKVGEQAVFFARLKGLSKRDAEKAIREWFDRLDMSGWWNKKIEELSKGMAQKVQFVITVLHNPELLIFDEPFSGFDPINANVLKEEIMRLRDRGATVIFSTHNMSSVEEICDRITLINNGRDILSGEVDTLRRQYGKGRLSLTFDGEPEALSSALQGLAVTETPQDAEAGLSSIVIEPFEGIDNRALIARANEAVHIAALQPVMPSMDNIFISAVRASEQSSNTESEQS